MFGRKKDEVVVRGVDEKFIMRFKDYNERKIGVSKTLEMLTKQLGELEKECVEIGKMSRKSTYCQMVKDIKLIMIRLKL